jgi:tetratricopeptide (TPR) repeat protein
MYNLLIALAIAALAFLLGLLIGGHWIAGFAPALFAVFIAYFLLARRSTRQLQKYLDQAVEALKKQKIDQARSVLEAARPLARWQFFIGQSIDSQLGAIAYMQRDFVTARKHLERSFSRNWSAMGMLAALDFRDGKVDIAVKRLSRCEILSKKEPLFWGLWAYLLVESKRQDEALAILARGLAAVPTSEALKGMREAVSNRKKLRMKAFGDQWYSFFPEQFPVQRIMGAPPDRGYPMPRR